MIGGWVNHVLCEGKMNQKVDWALALGSADHRPTYGEAPTPPECLARLP
jgi:hypothetical protein